MVTPRHMLIAVYFPYAETTATFGIPKRRKQRKRKKPPAKSKNFLLAQKSKKNTDGFKVFLATQKSNKYTQKLDVYFIVKISDVVRKLN